MLIFNAEKALILLYFKHFFVIFKHCLMQLHNVLTIKKKESESAGHSIGVSNLDWLKIFFTFLSPSRFDQSLCIFMSRIFFFYFFIFIIVCSSRIVTSSFYIAVIRVSYLCIIL